MTGKPTRKDLEQRIQLLEEELISCRQAEKALQASEEKYRTLFDSAGDAIFIHDRDGQILAANATACEQYGYTPSEFLTMQVSMVDVVEQIAHVRTRISRVMKQGILQFETVHRHKDGKTISVEVKAQQITWDNQPVIMSICRDITERKQAEEKLKAAEETYRNLFLNAQTGIFRTDIKTGLILDANDCVARFIGYQDRTELLSQPFNIAERYVDPADREKMISLLKEYGQFSNFETRFRRNDGTIIWMRYSAKIISGKGWLEGVSEDITKEKEIMERLRQSEERLKLAQVSSGAGVWDWNIDDGKLEWSRELFILFGLDPEKTELTFETWKLILHPEDQEIAQTRINQAIENRLQLDSDYRILLPDGRIRWIKALGSATYDSSGKPIRMSGISLDITERKLAEEALRKNEAILSGITKNMPGVIYQFYAKDTGEYGASYGGERLQEIFGITGSMEDLFPAFASCVHQEDYGRFQSSLQKAVETVTPWDFEGRFIKLSGEMIWFHGLSTPTPLKDRVVFDGILLDITDLRRAEEDRRRLELQLIQSQKMEAIGTLAGGIAHDFNNMLGIILGHAEIALMNVESSQRLYKNLEEIRKAAERSADLTRQLLAFARKQTVAPKVLDLNETVEGMLKMLRRLIGEDIELAWLPGNRLWRVKMDPSQIDQILVNLCVNARDAITGVGKITIETETAVFDKDYLSHHMGAFPGEYVLIAVSDSGSGMDKDILGKLFEPFFTTKALGKGTGLGLATIYGIVKQNNGFIDVYSEAGQGSTFKIYLPRHAGETEQSRQDNREASVVRGQGTILLVEDEPTFLNMTAKMLEHLGYTVLSAGTPGEAAHIAENRAGDIHLFMTDVIMPGMNGRDLAGNILSLYPNIRLLFMSGYTADIIAHQGVLDEGVHFIQKPFSLSRLADKIREAME